MHCATAPLQLLQERNKLEVKGNLSCINCKTADMQPVRLVGDDGGGVLLKVSRAYAEQLQSPADRRGTHLSSKRATLQKVRVSSAHTDPQHHSCGTKRDADPIRPCRTSCSPSRCCSWEQSSLDA